MGCSWGLTRPRRPAEPKAGLASWTELLEASEPHATETSLPFGPLLGVEARTLSLSVTKSLRGSLHGALPISAPSRGIGPAPPMTALASAGEVACPARSARGDPRPRPSTDVTVITVSHCPSPGSAVRSLAASYERVSRSSED